MKNVQWKTHIHENIDGLIETLNKTKFKKIELKNILWYNSFYIWGFMSPTKSNGRVETISIFWI